ncbi:MAG: glutamate 5-kinase [Candidatus Omnitrophota bacterium]
MLHENYKRIVIKVGSSLFYSQEGGFDSRDLHKIVRQVIALKKSGKEVVIVSSGAIALGMHILKWPKRPRQLHRLQAAASIGQNELIDTYRDFLKGEGIHIAQILLTWDDFNDRQRYLNAKNTFLELLKPHFVPIVNENDTVSTQEIQFGDNDRLSALVAGLISADILIILSDVDGLLEKDKKTIVRLVDEISPSIKALACPTLKKTCRGGMISKLEAAKIATDSGIPCVLANGRKKDIILSVLKEPQASGTLFLPKKGMAARKRWIAFSSKPKGRITVDEGARTALMREKSLLSVGITACEGDFCPGDIVSLVDKEGCEFARGRVSISCRELEKVKGARYAKEIIHRDNIAIL